MERVDFDPNGNRNIQNRGISGYVRISWDEAIDIVVNEINPIKHKYGPSAILSSPSSHHMWSNVCSGPIVGALVYFVLRQYLADLGSWYLIILGVAAVTVMLKLPMRIWSIVAREFDLSLFPARRRVEFDEGAALPPGGGSAVFKMVSE